MRRLLWISCAVGLLAAGTARAEDGISSPDEVRQRLRGPTAKIVNGVLEKEYPAVGALLFGGDPSTARTWCSGTMIGCETFLTAGHCVEGIPAGKLHVFLANAGMFTVAAVELYPDYEFPVIDIAVLKLGAAVDGVRPMPINDADTPPPGSPGTIVGFGRTGGNAFDFGLKRRGAIETRSCPTSSSFSGSVCWRITRPYGPPGTNSNTCNADSGGPLFIDFGAGEVVAGVTSGGSSGTCLANDLSFDTDVSLYSGWVQSAGGVDLLNTSCGALPQVGEALSRVEGFSGQLSSGAPEGVHAFEVRPGTTVLRVALNGSEENNSDFDLYVRSGSPPTPMASDCNDLGGNQYGFCEIAAPAPGVWYLMARRFAGSGPYHATVTTFGRDCSLAENDGLPCDDGSECTESDICGAGVCAGAPVLDGTACDDGNQCTTLDQCEAGVCAGSTVADGTPCDDGSGCTRPDTCQTGTCTGASPVESCKLPVVSDRALLRLKDTTPSSGDRLLWKFLRGAETEKSEFGDPTATTGFSLCIYDEVGGVPARILEQDIPPGENWTELANGFRYTDRNVEKTGVFTLLLRPGGEGQTRIIAKGKAHPLGMPVLGLNQDSKVTVQLVSDTGCWQTDHTSNLRNDSQQFKAR